MSVKIALVGAGSRSFGAKVLCDIMLSDPLNSEGVEIALMDIVADHLPKNERYAHVVAKKLSRKPVIRSTTSLEEAVDGADFVVTAIEVERYLYWSQDFHIPRQYGFMQIYGENGGPGGLFHALRNMGPMLEIARAVERLCPHAWLLNFTNPEHKLCEAVTRLTDVKAVGLCHGISMGIRQIAAFLGMAPDDLDTAACGLNHFTWFQRICDRRTGEDLYPLLREKEKQAAWLADWDEIALGRILFRTLGLWPSPGTNHYGEYIRWADEFLAASRIQYAYDPADGHPWQRGDVPPFVYSMIHHPLDTPLFPKATHADASGEAAPAPEELRPSGELAVPIIEAIACGVEHDLPAVNVPNRGIIPGLPDETVVEVPATGDRQGVHPIRMKPLPVAVTALLHTQASIHQLLVEAFAEQSRRKLLQAVLLDPTVNSYRNAVAMIDEMCALQRDILPPLGGWR